MSTRGSRCGAASALGERCAGKGRSGVGLALAFLVLLVLAAPAARAQDTTRAPADTARAPADTARIPVDTVRAGADSVRADTTRRDTTLRDTTQRASAPPRWRTLDEAAAMDFASPRRGRLLGQRPPVRDPALDATERLAEGLPGAFRYDLGGVGWPHGLSIRGRPPDQAALSLGGVPFDDPLTGRPRYDLLPLPFMQALSAEVAPGQGVRGAPGAVYGRLREYDTGRPLTDLRYRTRSLQSIGALHSQQRKVRFFGVPAFAQFTGGYFGRASDNLDFLPQDGGGLSTERRLLGRLRYRRRHWAVQVTALHNRRYLAASDGFALPADQPLRAVFFPESGRSLLYPNAERRLLRTDLSATLRADTPLARAPLETTLYRTTQTFRYRNPDLPSGLDVPITLVGADTLTAETVRYGLRLRQQRTLDAGRLGQHALTAGVHVQADRRTGGNALGPGAAHTRLHLSLRDSTRLLGSRATLSAGLHGGPVQTYPSAAAHLERVLRRPADGDTLRLPFFALPFSARVFGGAGLAGQPVAWIEEEGFGPLLPPLPEGETPGPVLSAEAGAAARAGPLAARFTLFAERTARRLDFYATGVPTAAAPRVAEGAFRRAGASLDLRWRAQAERGFYLTASGTALLPEPDAPTAVRYAVPRAFGRSRLGARYAFFTEDLGVDAYVEGRAWSRMLSRVLHGPTGRLALPPPDARRTLGPAGVLDLHAEATIRTATLFFSYENALGGSQVQAGVLNVPLYPLPVQRFRFGVYWPILN